MKSIPYHISHAHLQHTIIRDTKFIRTCESLRLIVYKVPIFLSFHHPSVLYITWIIGVSGYTEGKEGKESKVIPKVCKEWKGKESKNQQGINTEFNNVRNRLKA